MTGIWGSIALAVVYGIVVICVAGVLMNLVVETIRKYKKYESERSLKVWRAWFKVMNNEFPGLLKMFMGVIEKETSGDEFERRMKDVCQKAVDEVETEGDQL